ncbi:GTP-binding protein [Georgenia satyanarayanai]|uniref:GTP-binding protein n=1 Tax=Georgenia satyanarayanai TaxID=860221 RepID=UPI0012658B8E|nr:GTP-binding protein [Georgenia satyanarayanai]
MSEVPVITLCTTDEVLRGSAAGALLCDIPGAVVLQHDIDVHTGALRRVVYDASGVRSDTERRLDHACASCATREDILPTLEELVAQRPAAVVLALPTAIEAVPVLHALRTVPGAVPAGVATVVDLDALLDDLASGDRLGDRGLGAAPEDDRTIGEVVVGQLETADVVLVSGDGDERAQALVAHLVGPDRLAPWYAVPTDRLLDARPDPRRGDLLAVSATGAEPAEDVWTVDLSSWRPVHPERLMERAEELGGAAVRSKGHFWVASRPRLACAWDGAVGDVSIGRIGTWDGEPRTHLVVTGVGGEPRRVVDAFQEVLLTDVELAGGLGSWAGEGDGLDPWLGAVGDAV